MPLSSFEGETFVAFIDISGFKELMRNGDDAWRALDKFYNAGYMRLASLALETNKVEGLFVSDNGVLFVRTASGHLGDIAGNLKTILKAVRAINKDLIDDNFMTTTSIAYGRFKFQQRIEFEGIGKYPIFGDAYISAFLDNENGKPRIQPGQCRLIKCNLPERIKNAIKVNDPAKILTMIKERNGDNEHLYYYWMVNTPDEINDFERRYKHSYNLKYAGMLRALKGA